MVSISNMNNFHLEQQQTNYRSFNVEQQMQYGICEIIKQLRWQLSVILKMPTWQQCNCNHQQWILYLFKTYNFKAESFVVDWLIFNPSWCNKLWWSGVNNTNRFCTCNTSCYLVITPSLTSRSFSSTINYPSWSLTFHMIFLWTEKAE